MNWEERLSWGALYCNIGLTGFGLLTIFFCNVFRQGYKMVVLYMGGALFVGVPLFLITLLAAPAGALRGQDQGDSRRYRRFFLLNLSLVALIFIPATLATLFF
jgi:hypothetical protein